MLVKQLDISGKKNITIKQTFLLQSIHNTTLFIENIQVYMYKITV